MNRSRSLLTLALVLTACQAASQTDSGATPQASPTVALANSPTAPTDAATTSPAPAPAATATNASSADCVSSDPAAETDGWPLLESTDRQLSLRYPPDWQDLSGQISQPIRVAFDQETHDESGQSQGAELVPAIVRSAVNAFFVVSALEGIDSSASTLHDRHVAKVGIIGDDVLEAGLERCLDGEVAAGFTALNTDGSYYQSWFISRGGVAYHALGLDPGDEDALDRLLDQMLSTWEWTE